MMVTKETSYATDASNKKLLVERVFDAPVETVWQAWTQPELLDKWWAPKPWKANTVSMDFREGGKWFYYMEGPDGSRHYCKVDYKSIVPNNSFTGYDGFADEKGNTLTDPPGMDWKCIFKAEGDTTKVEIEVTFATEDDMKKIVEMGFKEGFAMAHTNLDEILAKQ
jgi:uncharacterized protein YndB with AHSA1/START domain